jgi:hypothetical protein
MSIEDDNAIVGRWFSEFWGHVVEGASRGATGPLTRDVKAAGPGTDERYVFFSCVSFDFFTCCASLYQDVSSAGATD